MSDAPVKYLTAPQIRARFSISESTFWRWEQDAKVGFPAPLRIGRKKLYAVSAVEDWERRHQLAVA